MYYIQYKLNLKQTPLQSIQGSHVQNIGDLPYVARPSRINLLGLAMGACDLGEMKYYFKV